MAKNYTLKCETGHIGMKVGSGVPRRPVENEFILVGSLNEDRDQFTLTFTLELLEALVGSQFKILSVKDPVHGHGFDRISVMFEDLKEED